MHQILANTSDKASFLEYSSKANSYNMSPEIKWSGPVWLKSSTDGQAYIGDVSECLYDCSYNRRCGTETECEKAKELRATSKLLIVVICCVASCGLCFLISKL